METSDSMGVYYFSVLSIKYPSCGVSPLEGHALPLNLGGKLLRRVMVKPETNRFRCVENKKVFYLDEMVNALQSDGRTSVQSYESIIAAWINLLRFQVIKVVAYNSNLMSDLQSGGMVFRLGKLLVPEGWTRENFGNHIAERTGVSFSTVCSTFSRMSQILTSLNGQKAFEPIGWLEAIPKAEGGGFRVYLWEDFPNPSAYDFEEEKSVSGYLS